MEGPTSNRAESTVNLERGANVTIRIDLLRHPEKDYATGKLTEAGKEALLEKLNDEYTEGEFDTVKCYVSPLSRGQESMEPIGQFLNENGISTVTRTRDQLSGRATEIGKGLKSAMTELIQQEDATLEIPREDPTRPAYEPSSKDFETASNHILIRDFFDQKFPDSSISGQDMGQEIDTLIKHLAKLASKMRAESKVKFVLISHSGVVEHFIKLAYLKSHPELKPNEVGVGDVGGLLSYMDGPQISITSDKSGKQAAKIQFKDVILDYELI